MGKRIYEKDIVAMALLYRKKYASTDILSYDKICKFEETINDNLDKMNSTCRVGIRCEETSNLYFNLATENGQACAVLNPNYDLKEAWKYNIGSCPIDVLIAIEMDNALKEIGLISVNDKIIDRTAYYNELRKKYNLLDEFSRQNFDIFRDWESISEDGFAENYCISNQEQLILKELRENKKTNDQNIENQLHILKKIRKK